MAKVRASLRWQSQVDSAALAHRLDLAVADVDGALAVLGSRGLAGFDAEGGRYFHRELPFDLDQVEEMQPRLGAARALVEDGRVRPLSTGEIFEVQGTGTVHRVSFANERQSCTCPWFSKYRGQRGPCKHILAASIVANEAEAATR